MTGRLATPRFRRMLLLLAVALVFAGSFTVYSEGRGASADDGKGFIEHPTGAGDVVLRIEYQGGFVMPQVTLSRLPVFTLYGNGCFIVEGPMIEIYPGPSLPNLQQTCLTEEGVQKVLKMAAEAGLLDAENVEIGDAIGDAPTTVFTVNANGKTYVTRAYALGDLADTDEFTAEEIIARQALIDFQQTAVGIDMELPESMIAAPARAFEFDSLKIIVLPAGSNGSPDDIEPMEIEWPLAVDLGKFGEPVEFLDGARTGVVSGAELEMLLDDLVKANTLTVWTSNGAEYNLLLVPVLPDNT
jgi:hypothetical protein